MDTNLDTRNSKMKFRIWKFKNLKPKMGPNPQNRLKLKVVGLSWKLVWILNYGCRLEKKLKLVNLENLVLRGTMTSSKNLKCSNCAKTWYTDRIKDADYDSKIQIIQVQRFGTAWDREVIGNLKMLQLSLDLVFRLN